MAYTTQKINDAKNLDNSNATLEAQLNATQQALAKSTKGSNSIQRDINDRYNAFISAQHLSVEMLSLYRRQRKVMWIYVVVLILLLGGLSFLYHNTYDPESSIFTEKGRNRHANSWDAFNLSKVWKKKEGAAGETEAA
jgi:hypothetical protein